MQNTSQMLLLDAVYEQERNHPDRVYLTQPVGRQVIDYSWGETMDQARRMAAYLRALELPPNSNIALISKNCAHFIMCDLAIWMAGHVTVALYPTLTPDTVAWILEHSESRLLFVGKLDDWEEMEPGVPASLPRVVLPLAHLMERMIIEIESFYSGGHIYFTETLDTFLQDLNRARPNRFVSVPRLWLKFQLGVFQNIPEQELERLLQDPEKRAAVGKQVLDSLGLGEVEIAISGSAPIPAELIEWYDRVGLTLLEGYGMSEDFAYSHLSTPELHRYGYVGPPWPDVQSRISDDGEIQVKSPGNMLGYYKAPELTAECYTEDGFFKTGDRGEYSADGLLKITGRTKELFKTSKGKYVAPVPIENLLNADSHIELSCVSGLGRPACYAVIQLAEELRGKIGDQDFRDKLTSELEAVLVAVNSKLESYETLQFLAVARDEWQVANEFLTPTQKIKRDAIESAYSPYLDDWYTPGKKVVWQD